KIRILGGYLGNDPIDANRDLLKISFKAKTDILDDTAVFHISKLLISDAVDETELSSAPFGVQIKSNNAASLGDLIETATETLEGAVEGKHIGQYPVGSKATLAAAIQRATAVYTNENATEESIAQATSDLQHALQLFLDSVIVSIPGDYNQDDGVSVSDLA